MKTSKLFVTLFAGAILMSSSIFVYSNTDNYDCDSSNKNPSIITKEFDVEPFNGISANAGIQIHYTQADTYSVLIATDEETMKKLEVETVSGRLALRLKQDEADMTINIQRINDNCHIAAYISAPDLNGVDLSGWASLNATEFSNTSDFKFSGSGVSGLNIDKMTLNNAHFNCSGASFVISKVIKAGNVNFHLSGSSQAEMELNSGNANVNISGISTFKAQGKTTAININCSGSSNANLKGLSYSNSSFSSSGEGIITK